MGINFYIIGLALIAVFTASSTVIPLLGEIQTTLDLKVDDLAIVSLAYFGGSCVALLFLSRISNSLGRKVVALSSLSLAFLSCIIFYTFSTALEVYIARFIQGLATGLATSAIMSFVIDSVPENKRNVATTFNVCGPGLGFLFGSFASIALIEYTTFNPLIIFICIALIIAICIVGIYFKTQETVTINHATLKHNLIPKIEVPPAYRMVVMLTCLIFVFTWFIGGFFQAFLPIVATDNFDMPASLSGVLFLVFMIPQTFGGFLVKQYAPHKAMLYCCFAFALSVMALFLSAYYGLLIPFCIASFLTGGLASAATSAAMSYTIAPTTIEERAGMIASIYLAGFLGAGLPNFILGKVATQLDFNLVLLMYIAIILGGTLLISLCYYLIVPKFNAQLASLKQNKAQEAQQEEKDKA